MAGCYRAGLVPKVSRHHLLPVCQGLTLSRCDAEPDHLDDGGARRRTHEKTDFLIDVFDPGILWSDFGVRDDVVVSRPILHTCEDVLTLA